MAHVLEKKIRTKDVLINENADFSSMLLCDRVLRGLTKAGFKKPSPIQLVAIPTGRFGKDLFVQAKSGTGKTLVFVIVALETLSYRLFRPQVLILVPTREIATQICSVVKSVGSSFHKLRCESFIGGLSVADDIKKANNCQIAVGTPGRIKQLINLKALSTNSIRLVVFDEADELLHYAWQGDIEEIFNSLPEDKQVIATSATYPVKLKKIMFKYLRDPYIARLNLEKLALLGIIHYAKIVEPSSMPLKQYDLRRAALEPILKTLQFTQCLVYCNGIQKVETLYRDIKKWGFSTTYISSNRNQLERLKAIEYLKRFKCKVLVSSDVTARGIDAENVDLVINFDLSYRIENYLHRSGRAGRYGTTGVTISIIDEYELKNLEQIEKNANFKSYILPDPLPVDLIQNPSFEKYVIEVSDGDNVSEDEKKKSPCANKEANAFFSRKHGAKLDNADQMGSKCSLSTTHNSVNSEKQNGFSEAASAHNSVNSEKQNGFSEDASAHNSVSSEKQNGFSVDAFIEISSPVIDDFENKEPNINEKPLDRNQNISEFSVNGNLEDSIICDDISKICKSLEVKSDYVCQSETSVIDCHDLNLSVLDPKVSSCTISDGDKISAVLGEFKELDVISSPLESECIVNTQKNICDTDSKESPIQSDIGQNIENILPEASSSSPIKSTDETDLDIHNDGLSQVIEIFVNNYEANRNGENTYVLSSKESSVAENLETDITLPSNVRDFNSKKSDYYYKVFKLFLEENACSNSENKMQENLEENENIPKENEFCTKEKVFSGEASDEVILSNLQKANTEHPLVRPFDLDMLKPENLKEFCDNATSENNSILDYDVSSDSCGIPGDESTPYCDKSKYKVTTLFDRNTITEPQKSSSTFFDELSEDSSSESDIISGNNTSIHTSHCSSKNSESESCSESSDFSSTSFSLDNESSEEDNESGRTRESFDGSETSSHSSSFKKEFVSGRKNAAVHCRKKYSASKLSTNKRSQQPSHSRLVNSHQKLYHSGHLNANQQQPHLSRCLSTCQCVCNSVNFPIYQAHNSAFSVGKQCVYRVTQNSVGKRNHPPCSSGSQEHSPLCFMPSEHRCHPYNDNIDCKQREICAQWYQIFYSQWMHIQRHSYFTN